MTKNEKIIFGIVGAALVVGAIFFWGGYKNQVNDLPDIPQKNIPKVSEKCGIENCHGLEITCGSNVPDACTEMYAIGDGCRQFASCKNVGGECSLEKAPKFDSCKACVQKCEKSFPSDPMKVSECESKCLN